ncbi:ferredoxin--nitrite reductase [Chlorella sorokiniana]|uniref:Ferredoxin--nitrite reductase, chloroplastic n=1 Tax=Chlorella sorokiniana TaxID=3076 RepID=A0A2P6TEN2_CHLSO|nr:ferredoxin--nitrite reductase [Chlorella sorokiniana]|eukprot:PRW21087.1 ferredoxin--nitrite reductase [Chlorella sorokiniana]
MRAAVTTHPAAPARPCTAGSSAGRVPRHAAVPRRSVARRAVEAPGAEVPPLSEEVAAKLAELGIDFDRSGLKYLSNDARMRALDRKSTKFEKTKNEKCGSHMWSDVTELAALIREGKTSWEDLDLDDVDVRLKWAGLFHRRKRTPGRFMMRLKLPNGELTSEQLRFLGDCIAPYGEDGCADITTRANIQLRGIQLEDADRIIEGLRQRGLTSFMSGMDNVRNITGSPIAGIDPHELIDTRPLCHALNDAITSQGAGNAALTNLPRKINIGISSSRDDFAHCHINDVGLKAVRDPESGRVGFNVELGGYFSIKRNVMSISGDTFLTQEQVVPYCIALLEVFRDHGARDDRQKARLMWLVEAMGVDAFRSAIEQRMGQSLRREVHVAYDDVWERRDVLGIHPQAQEGLHWAGACVPAGRLLASDFHALADAADTYGDGSVRLTVEENVIVPNVPQERLAALQADPLFQRFPVQGGNLLRGLVSCTGAQFCSLALVETKNRALEVVRKLEAELDIPRLVRMHWTGCPNSCGQAQVGDIGLMGAPAKLDGKAVEGVKIFLGGKIGENPELAKEFERGIPVDESILLPRLRDLLISEFGATPKQAAQPAAGASAAGSAGQAAAEPAGAAA